MGKLIIHAGIGKTGTSSIQVAMLKYKDELASQGIVAIESNQSKPELSAKHKLKWRKPRHPAWKELRKESRRLARTDKTAIISNETLWKRDEGDLRFLKKILRGFDITVVLYVREQVEYLESRTLQAVKQDRNSLQLDFSDPDDPKGLEGFLSRFDEHLDFLEVARRWDKVFGKGTVQARLYSRDVFTDGNVVADFFETVGASTEGMDLNTEMNPSLSAPFAAIMSDTARYFPPEIPKSEALDAALRLSRTRRTNVPKLISPARAKEIRERVADSNRVFFDEYVVNGDEFRMRDWSGGDVCDLEELAEEMVSIIKEWPLVAYRTFGPEVPRIGVFKDGWDAEPTEGGYRAVQTGESATIRFRLHIRAKTRSGSDNLRLHVHCLEEEAVRLVKVGDAEPKKIDLKREAIVIPGASLGEYDNVEIELSVPEGEDQALTVTLVRLAETGEKN